MNCPKCNAAVDALDTECPHCGVILARAMPESFRPSHPRFEPAPRQKASWPAAPVVAILVVMAAVYAFHHRGAARAGETLPCWYADAAGYNRAISEQSVNSQAVLVYFHTDWCGWCKKLDADLFRTTAFSKRYPAVIKVKVNAEGSAGDRGLASQYGVSGFPTVIVVRGGRPAERIVGYREPDAYMAQLDSLVN